MYSNYEYIEAIKKEKELHKELISNGELKFCNEYNGGNNLIKIKFIYYNNENYYVVENYAGDVVELRKISQIIK